MNDYVENRLLFLEEEIEILKPKLLVAVDNVA
jgi:uracil-DNA glycosylase